MVTQQLSFWGKNVGGSILLLHWQRYLTPKLVLFPPNSYPLTLHSQKLPKFYLFIFLPILSLS